MEIGTKVKVQSDGRLLLPRDAVKFYHFDEGYVFLHKTEEGLLITNPQYKVVKIEQ